MRGRAFASIALLCATWVAVRIAFTASTVGGANQPVHNANPAPVRTRSTSNLPMHQATGFATTHQPKYSKRDVAALAWQPVKSRRMQVIPKQTDAAPILLGANNPTRIAPPAFLPAGPEVFSLITVPPRHASTAQPFEVYAYSFWRRGASPAGSLGNGRYGGSQSAVITAIPLLRFPREPGLSRLSLTGRVSVAHGRLRERELATGVRWRPVARLPVQVFTERRFREDRPDAFAALVAGGQSDVKLPLGFRLDGYGQAGVVSGEGGGPFADVAVQAHRPLAKSGRASLSAGAGIWGGGQDNVMRIDVGPNIRANVMAGGAQFQLDASWRFRIAGQAQPGNGPTVTLSTSF